MQCLLHAISVRNYAVNIKILVVIQQMHWKIHTASLRSQAGASKSYPPLSCFMKGNVDIIIASKDVDADVLELFKIERLAANDFSSVAITSRSAYDNWKPVSVDNSVNNLFWLSLLFWNGFSSSDQSLKMATISLL